MSLGGGTNRIVLSHSSPLLLHWSVVLVHGLPLRTAPCRAAGASRQPGRNQRPMTTTTPSTTMKVSIGRHSVCSRSSLFLFLFFVGRDRTASRALMCACRRSSCRECAVYNLSRFRCKLRIGKVGGGQASRFAQ